MYMADGTSPHAPEPPSALPCLAYVRARGGCASAPVPAAARTAEPGHTCLHTCTHPMPRSGPSLAHGLGCGTHFWLLVSCRTASGPVAWVGSHGGGGGAVGAGPPVCRDPVLCAVQVSRQETWSCCSAPGHAVLWGGWGWRGVSSSCSHPSPGTEDAASWSYHSSAVRLLSGAHEHFPQGWAGTVCAKRRPPLLLLPLPLLLSPRVLTGNACKLVRGPEGGCAESSMPLLLNSAGPWGTSASPLTQDCPLLSQEKEGLAQQSQGGPLHR